MPDLSGMEAHLPKEDVMAKGRNMLMCATVIICSSALKETLY